MANTMAPPAATDLSSRELRRLTELPAEPSLSLYMSTYRSGPEVRQNPVRLKNLLRQAHDRLRQGGSGGDRSQGLAAEITRLVESVDELVAEPLDGLALFLRAGSLRIYKVPLRFPDLVAVSSWFHVAPLLEYLQGDGRFFVLAVSQKDVRLLEGDKHSLREVEVDQLPKNLVDALNVDEWVQSIQFHTEGPGGRSSIRHGGGMFFGHGGGADQSDRKSDITAFFRTLDNALTNYFHDESAPLVFAGVDYLFPIYQSVNNYRGLVDRAIAGNPEGWGADHIHGLAWEIVRPRFEADRASAIEQYGTLAARRQASDVLLQILEATRVGRVGTLLVAKGAQEFGVVDAGTESVSLADRHAAHSEDLLGLAAAQTIGSSGTVYLVEPSHMPTDSPVAALYRY
ncbi:MAG: hypothetical protein IT424_14570 [Pirellulales bacterium]|nr:hypothetical protein [Pirellulales bacterium]